MLVENAAREDEDAGENRIEYGNRAAGRLRATSIVIGFADAIVVVARGFWRFKFDVPWMMRLRSWSFNYI